MSHPSSMPISAKYLVLGFLIGTVYGVGLSSAWRYKSKSTSSMKGNQASATGIRSLHT